MKYNKGINFVVIFVLLFGLVFVSYAQGPDTPLEKVKNVRVASLSNSFTYQGRLEQSDNVANGSFDFTFSLFDQLVGGTQIGDTIATTTTVVDGLFTVNLDFGTDIFMGDARYLEIQVRSTGNATFTMLTPRQELTASPYSLYALNAGNVGWNSVSNIPSDIADGDDVGLTEVSWTDVQSRPAGLDDGDDVGLTEVSWTDVQSRPTGLDDGDDVGLTEISWTDVQSRPTGLDDGDDDTTYTAGTGLNLSTNEFSIDYTSVASITHTHQGSEITSKVATATLALSATQTSWNGITDIPADIADGDDGLTSESDPEVGTNTTNYVSKWDGSALVKGTLYDNGNLGIGTVTPSEKLHLSSGNLLQTPGNPTLVSSLGLGGYPKSVKVSGHYVYVVDEDSNDLKIIDVSDPSTPNVVGSVSIGDSATSMYVSGRYAYVVDQTTTDLKVIDVSNPGTPALVGTMNLGNTPASIYVSGRYAYVVDIASNDLKVIDVSDPTAPILAGKLTIGDFPLSVYVSGRYAYVVDGLADDLKVIDVSDPSSPSLSGSLSIGAYPFSVHVSEHYAYVVDGSANDLKVIDVSDPSSPSLSGSLSVGTFPTSVYVSGHYAYVVHKDTNDLRVIDVSDPSTPSLSGSLSIGAFPTSVYVSGHYAYVVDQTSDDLKIIDVSGAEVTSLIAHSVEAGNLQVRNDIIAQGELQVTSGINVGTGGIFSDGDVGINGETRFNNYIQLDTVSSTPPSADCDEASEEGRMKFDPTSDILYLCSGVSGWVSK